MRGVAKMANVRNMLGTIMINVLLSFNFAAILYKIYFLFRFAIQLTEQAMTYKTGIVLLTYQLHM
jgi:hypothetical protein